MFRNRYFIWQVDGTKQYLCPTCNQAMERRQSKLAMKNRFGLGPGTPTPSVARIAAKRAAWYNQ